MNAMDPAQRTSAEIRTMQVCRRIREIRKAKGLRLVDVGRRLGSNASYAHKLETNLVRLTVENLFAIATALGVEAGELLGPVASTTLQPRSPGAADQAEVADLDDDTDDISQRIRAMNARGVKL